MTAKLDLTKTDIENIMRVWVPLAIEQANRTLANKPIRTLTATVPLENMPGALVIKSHDFIIRPFEPRHLVPAEQIYYREMWELDDDSEAADTLHEFAYNKWGHIFGKVCVEKRVVELTADEISLLIRSDYAVTLMGQCYVPPHLAVAKYLCEVKQSRTTTLQPDSL